MPITSKTPRSRKPSIKYNGRPLDGASFELPDSTDRGFSPSSSDNSRKIGRNSEPGCSEILSTPQLVSKVGQIWDRASRPLAFLQPRRRFRYDSDEYNETNVLFHSGGKHDIALNSMTIGQGTPLAREDLHFLEVSDKISTFGPQGFNFVHSRLRNSYNSKDTSPALEISYELRERYRWMAKRPDLGPKQQVDSTLVGNQKTYNKPTSEDNLVCTDSPPNNLSTGSADHAHQKTEVTFNVLETPDSRICEDSHVSEECQLKDEEVNLCASENRQEDEVLVTVESENEVLLPTHSKFNYGFAKQEHAFAGALAGLSVSLCLHPMDTVKTVIQTCRADQRSIN